MRKSFQSLVYCVVLTVALFTNLSFASAMDDLRLLPVQDGGRVKPFDTLSREVMQLVYGSQTYNGKPAYEVVMTWMLAPEVWAEKKFIRLDHKGLKKAMKLPEGDEKYFSPQEIMTNPRLDLVLSELKEMRLNNEKLTPYFQAVQRLENQLMTLHGLRQGAMRLVPPQEGQNWIALAELSEEQKKVFGDLSAAFAQALTNSSEKDVATTPQVQSPLNQFETLARQANPQLYPDESVMKREVHYNTLHPFRWAWILYIIAAVLSLLAWLVKLKPIYWASWVSALVGFGFHIYGFVLRMILTGRPPVSNMYESVVWVAFGVVLFAMIFEGMRKRSDVLMAGGFVAALCLIVADNAPVILDGSLQPLEPVLRSNLWLTVHVLTITLSYAPLFLAFAVGTVGLFFLVKGEVETSERIKSLAQATYRCIQIGVVLLAAGTILGGVWADYSWGRFWGWDPKETWAFIALMGYLALLHARLVGWVRSFGMMAGAVVAFNLVIMAWYGVNFVLGAGLHSYGFGAGGIEYVAGFCGFFLLFTLYAYVARVKQLKQNTR